MSVRRCASALASALGLFLPVAASAQAFEYAPGNAQFRVTQKTKSSTEMMGQKQDGEQSMVTLFSMTLTRPAKDTILASYVIDSLALSNSMGMSAPGLDRFKGMKVEVKASPNGSVVHSVKGPTEMELQGASLTVAALGAYLPRMRATLARGATWSDTVSGKVNQFGIDLDRRIFSRHDVLKDTTVNGVVAWKVQRSDSTVMSGSGSGQSGPMTMEGSTVGTTTFLVSSKGMLLGAEGTENGKVRVVLSSNGMEINVTTVTETKAEKVK